MLVNNSSDPSKAGTDTQAQHSAAFRHGQGGELKPHFKDERRLREGRAFIHLTTPPSFWGAIFTCQALLLFPCQTY